MDIDREVLEARIKLYLDPQVPDETIDIIAPSTMSSTKTYKAKEVRLFLQTRASRSFKGKLTEETREKLSRIAFRPWQIIRYTYRPFDVRWLYWEPETNLLDRNRLDQIQDIATGNLLIEARQRESSDQFCRGSVAMHFPDNFGAGLSTFFPLFTLATSNMTIGEEAGKPIFAQLYAANLSHKAWSYINELFQDWPPNEKLTYYDNPYSLPFFHALAIMHTPQYRTENAGALLGDWPRIPLPSTAELLAHSAELGRRLAELLDAESAVKLGKEWSFLAVLKVPAGEWKAEHLLLTAGWGSRGQGSTVMPGRGKTTERAWTPMERDRIGTLAAAQGLTLEGVLGLLGETCLDIHLNGAALWSGVPGKVWSYTLGGYQVLKKWLSYREGTLLGRPLREEEAAYFAQVARRIAAILLLGPALDASYGAILPGATGLAGRNADSLRE